MDFKKIVDQVKGKAGELKDKAEDLAEDLKDKAGEKIQAARASMDKDGDNVPDALEGLADKAKTLAGEAQVKAKDLAGKAEVKLEELKGKAEKTVASARERMSGSDKDVKKG